VACESIGVDRKKSFRVDFGFATGGFFPFKRAISRNRRPVNRREKRGSKKPACPLIVFSDREIQRNLRFDLALPRVSVGASRPMS
jgi:hypothetical protein